MNLTPGRENKIREGDRQPLKDLAAPASIAKEEPINRERGYLLPHALQFDDFIKVLPINTRVNDDRIAYHTTNFVSHLEEDGYRVVLGSSVTADSEFLDSPSPKNLISAVQPDSSMVYFAKGRDPSMKFLELLNFSQIADRRKIFVGSGSATALLNGIFVKTGLVTFLGCEPRTGEGDTYLNNSARFNFSYRFGPGLREQVFKLFCSEKGLLRNGPEVSGPLVGGDISQLVTLISTEFEPDWQDAILLLEGTHLEPAHLEAHLWQLKMIGAMAKLKGIILGRFDMATIRSPESIVRELVTNIVERFNFPVVYSDIFGHKNPGHFLPIGRVVTFRPSTLELVIPVCCNQTAKED